MSHTDSREELRHYRIPESDVPTTRRFLRALIDPVELAILTAPEDDEPESDRERIAVESARADPSPDIPFESLRGVRN